ncbi:NAD(P)-binding protein [Melanomma pulvis-pyrius CBS 109.77]|uniref:NAD(P)-binding protein n=1 Tax=Melanomma pulvis-pyrius CBS 109.77 TaxID=1314802 RepID=A0A6A6X2N4_9PLEO|nr:NAD(P)-binding protein [Melanomma pulvis-pyrius CBS 109.77]
MSSLIITEDSIPDLAGKTAVVTGGSSGIGLGTVQVLLDHNARVFILDVSLPPSDILSKKATYIQTDIASWPSLVQAFTTITTVHKCAIDIAIGNAGVFETESYATQCLAPLSIEPSAWSTLEHMDAPTYGCVEVNLKGTLNFVMLAARVMRGQESGGSIVLTSSTTAYLPEQTVPVYSATKAALVNLVRALRPTFPLHNISISGVAPSATLSAMVPQEITSALSSSGLPVSTGRHVGLALVYSATAMQRQRVENYGKDEPVTEQYEGRWNGRIIHTIGDTFWEVEEKLAETKGQWWGEANLAFAKKQQIVTDARIG